MKKILLSVLILCLLFSLVGCLQKTQALTQNNNESFFEKNEVPSSENYSLSVVNGNYYLNFLDTQNRSASQLGSLSFESLDALIDAIENNKFADWQYDVISAFPKDENGIVIFDLNHAFDAKIPDGMYIRNIEWEGSTYSFGIGDEKGPFAYLFLRSPEVFSSVFKREYEEFFEGANTTITKKEYVEDRNAEVIWFETGSGKQKEIRYSLPNGVVVVEKYRITSIYSFLDTSETVPAAIHLYSENENCCFTVSIGGLNERPAVEWLLQFGVKSRTNN